jgi:ferredoxin
LMIVRMKKMLSRLFRAPSQEMVIEKWRKRLMKRQARTLDTRLITRVWLDETELECDACGACEVTCPEVFTVPIRMQIVENATFEKNEYIKAAAEGCPLGVIAIEFNNSGQRDNPF